MYPILSGFAFAAFVVAAILKLVNQHVNAVIWLLIVGDLLLAADMIFGAFSYYRRRRAV